MKRKFLIFIILISAVIGFVLRVQDAGKSETAKTTPNESKTAEKASFSTADNSAESESSFLQPAAIQTTNRTSTTNSSQVEPKKRRNEFALYKSDRFSSFLSFELPDFKIEEREINGKTYSVIQSEGKNRPLNNKGLPALPVFKQELLIPVGSTPKLVINKNSFREIEMKKPPLPGVGPILRKQKIPKPEEGDFYSSNETYPKSEVRMSRSFKFRGLQAVTIFVSPYRYDNDKKVLRVYDGISFTVETDDSEEILLSEPLKTKDFARSAEETFINYEEAGEEYLRFSSRSLPVPEKGKILIVAPQKFISELGEFVQWKKQIGFQVEFHTYKGEGVEALRLKIKDKIASGTSHVILMGDHAEIPARKFIRFYNNSGFPSPHWITEKELADEGFQDIKSDAGAMQGSFYIKKYNKELKIYNANYNVDQSYTTDFLIYSDLYYAGVDLRFDLAQSDVVMDCYISRFSTSSLSELKAQLHKVVSYERGEMFYGNTGQWSTTALMTASNDGGYGAYLNKKDYEFLSLQTSALRKSSAFDSFVEVYDPNAGINALINGLNSDVALTYYLGHGSHVKWHTTGFNRSHLPSVTSSLPSVSIQPVCQTGCIEVDCLAEDQMNSAAFVGILAATNDTFWNPPMVQIEAFTQNTITDKYETAGGTIFDSIQQAVNWAGKELAMVHRDATAAQLHCFGDCSMGIRTKAPGKLELEFLNEVELGNDFEVKVTAGGNAAVDINVSLMFDDIVISKDTDDAGLVNFGAIDHSGMYTVTAWKRNYIVAQEFAAVGNPVILQVSQFAADQAVLNLNAVFKGSDFSVDNPLFYIQDGILKAAVELDIEQNLELAITYTSVSGSRGESLQAVISLTPGYNKGYRFGVEPGWNLLGSPISSQYTAEELLKDENGMSLINSKLFYLPFDAKEYVQRETSELLVEQLGFWVHGKQKKLSAAFSGLSSRGVMTDLNIGWNLYAPAVSHSIPSGAECVWQWNAETQSYHKFESETLKPTIGYWVFMIK